MLIGIELKKIRKDKKLLQVEVVKLITDLFGPITSQSYISKVEKGQLEPSLSLIVAYKAVFDISIDALVLRALARGCKVDG